MTVGGLPLACLSFPRPHTHHHAHTFTTTPTHNDVPSEVVPPAGCLLHPHTRGQLSQPPWPPTVSPTTPPPTATQAPPSLRRHARNDGHQTLFMTEGQWQQVPPLAPPYWWPSWVPLPSCLSLSLSAYRWVKQSTCICSNGVVWTPAVFLISSLSSEKLFFSLIFEYFHCFYLLSYSHSILIIIAWPSFCIKSSKAASTRGFFKVFLLRSSTGGVMTPTRPHQVFWMLLNHSRRYTLLPLAGTSYPL